MLPLSTVPVRLRGTHQLSLVLHPGMGDSSQLERSGNVGRLVSRGMSLARILTKVLPNTDWETEARKIALKICLPCSELLFCSKFPIPSKQRTLGVYHEHKAHLEENCPSGESAGITGCVSLYGPTGQGRPHSVCHSFVYSATVRWEPMMYQEQDHKGTISVLQGLGAWEGHTKEKVISFRGVFI